MVKTEEAYSIVNLEHNQRISIGFYKWDMGLIGHGGSLSGLLPCLFIRPSKAQPTGPHVQACNTHLKETRPICADLASSLAIS